MQMRNMRDKVTIHGIECKVNIFHVMEASLIKFHRCYFFPPKMCDSC